MSAATAIRLKFEAICSLDSSEPSTYMANIYGNRLSHEGVISIVSVFLTNVLHQYWIKIPLYNNIIILLYNKEGLTKKKKRNLRTNLYYNSIMLFTY